MPLTDNLFLFLVIVGLTGVYTILMLTVRNILLKGVITVPYLCLTAELLFRGLNSLMPWEFSNSEFVTAGLAVCLVAGHISAVLYYTVGKRLDEEETRDDGSAKQYEHR